MKTKQLEFIETKQNLGRRKEKGDLKSVYFLSAGKISSVFESGSPLAEYCSFKQLIDKALPESKIDLNEKFEFDNKVYSFKLLQSSDRYTFGTIYNYTTFNKVMAEVREKGSNTPVDIKKLELQYYCYILIDKDKSRVVYINNKNVSNINLLLSALLLKTSKDTPYFTYIKHNDYKKVLTSAKDFDKLEFTLNNTFRQDALSNFNNALEWGDFEDYSVTIKIKKPTVSNIVAFNEDNNKFAKIKSGKVYFKNQDLRDEVIDLISQSVSLKTKIAFDDLANNANAIMQKLIDLNEGATLLS